MGACPIDFSPCDNDDCEPDGCLRILAGEHIVIPEFVTQPASERPSCACVSRDGQTCYARRYKVLESDLGPDDRCECCCHDPDEDDWTEWDDEYRIGEATKL